MSSFTTSGAGGRGVPWGCRSVRRGPGLRPRRPQPGRVELSPSRDPPLGPPRQAGARPTSGTCIPRAQPGVRPRWPVPGLGRPPREATFLWTPPWAGRARLSVPPEPLTCLANSPDGRRLAATGNNGRRGPLWDLEGRRGPADRDSAGRHPPAFSPDGRLLAMAGDERAVRLGTSRPARSCATSAIRPIGSPRGVLPDGKMLAATGNDAESGSGSWPSPSRTGPSRDKWIQAGRQCGPDASAASGCRAARGLACAFGIRKAHC